MGFFFLSASPTYRARTPVHLFRRRQVVAEHLNDEYKAARKNTILETCSEILSREGITMTAATLHSNKAQLRAAYLWLKAEGNEQERARLLTIKVPVTANMGIYALKTDMLTWAAVCSADAMRTQPEPPVEATPYEEVQPAQTPIAVEQTPAPEIQTPTPPVLKPVPILAALDRVRSNMEELLAEQKRVVEDDTRLRDENARLLSENARLTQELETSLSAAQGGESEAYIAYADEEIALMTSKLQKAHDACEEMRVRTLEDIANASPEFPILYTIVQQMREGKTRRERKINDLLARMPSRFTWANDEGAIRFLHPFWLGIR